MPWPVRLEDRRLLSGVAAEAVPLALDLPVDGMIVPLGTTYYQIASDAGGKLTVTLQAVGFAARVSLVDASGNPLVQSDGPAVGTGTGAGLVDVNVPAGSDFVEVQSLGGSGTYQLTAKLAPTDAPFETVPSLFSEASQLAEGDFNGDGIPDLVAPDGIHLGTGDGTFLSQVIDGPLGTSGWFVTAVAAGTFNQDHLEDIAFTQISPDGSSAKLCVLQDVGGGKLTQTACLAVEPCNDSPEPSTIHMIDFGGGFVDLAVADQSTGTVVIFVGDGKGGFTQGPTLCGLDQPAGLATGRFGDGYVDLIVADQGGDQDIGDSGGLTVFQAHAQDQFVLSRTIDVGSGPSAVVAGDFTGDGVLDLAVAEENSDDVSVLLNNGDGTFNAPRSYAVGSAPLAIVACNFGNGHVDLATANSNSNDVSILLGNGDGTFQPQLRFVAGSSPESLVAYDLNGDGRPDLAVGDLGSSGDLSGEITVLLGRGDGTFQDQATNLVGNGPMDAVTADLNDDGHLDIITANYYSNDISVLMGNGDGTFQTAQSFAAGAGPTALVVRDFNGDGLLDVAVVDRGNNDGVGAGVAILLGDGDGTFQSPVFYAAGAVPVSIVAGEFTGNDIVDLAVANHGSNNVSILLGNGDGGFVTLPPVNLGNTASGPIAITSGDFGNGEFDLAVANRVTDNVSILLGNGRGDFVALTPIPLGTDMDSPSSIVEGDFSRGDSADLAVASTSTDGRDSVTILIGQGQGQFAGPELIGLGMDQTPTSITVGQFFGGDSLDLAIADSTSDQVSLLQGDGHGGFGPPSVLSLGTQGAPMSIATGDFNGDKETDLAIALQSPDSVMIELNQGNAQFTQPDSASLVPRNTPIVADFTGDDVPDVAIVDGAGAILFRQGVANEPGTFEPPITINPSFPSRDIAAVVTDQGVLLASVDATDNFVRWFTYHNGHFSLTGTLATGLTPAQIVAADLNGNGDDDLIIRNAGDGTLAIYMSNPLAGGFLPPITLAVGPGIADVSVADINQDGRLDILLANQPAGEVEVIMRLGDGSFSQPIIYRGGTGLSAVIGGTGTTPLSIFSQDGTIGVAAAALAPGAPPDILALNSGAETLGILTGMGDGRFANPYSLPTTGPTLAVGVADFNGDGNPDLAILGTDGLAIWLNNGTGVLVPAATYNVGPDPTGLTIADISGDKVADLVVGNAFGDVLVLLGEGNGLFQPPTITKQSVALAVTYPKGSSTPTFVFSDQASDRVVVKSSSEAPTVLADSTSGLLAPGLPVLMDLNGDKIPDLIVVNTGGNDVFVYPGLPGGKFGPALNDGNGFFTGTDPVAVVVANLNGRPDLLVANEGSNSVSVLLNEPKGNSFTFVSGPQIRAGYGPVGLLYGDFFGNGADELVVSDSGSNNLMVLPSLGNGFFNDVDPMIIPLDESPGLIITGQFGPGAGPDIVALDPGTGDVTVISGLSNGSSTVQELFSGGEDPVAALVVNVLNGFDDLVVVNYADGRVALLVGGPQGLTLEEVNDSLDGTSPTGLDLAFFHNNNLDVFASIAGEESPTLLGFSLGGLGGSSSIAGGQALTLLPLSDFSLPLIATLLTPSVNLNATEEGPGGSPDGIATVVAMATATTSLGQGPFSRNVDNGGDGNDGEFAIEPLAVAPVGSEKARLSPWLRLEIGVDEAFEEFRRARQRKAPIADGFDEDEENQLHDAAPPTGPPLGARHGEASNRFALVDAAIKSLAARYCATPVIPEPECACPVGMTNNRLERGTLTSAAFVVLLASSRRARRCDWRTSENDKPGEVPLEDA